MEELPTQEDLRKATMSLNKLHSPRLDGVLVEFYLASWESISHLLHFILLKGIHEGNFFPIFIKGVIVLLPKFGDFQLLDNKQPITLLNSMFKIFLKHYQLLLAKVCMDFINPYQSAFIPGRMIHHALLLATKALHRA